MGNDEKHTEVSLEDQAKEVVEATADRGPLDPREFTGVQTIKDLPTGDFRGEDLENLDVVVEVDESNLVAHARRELELLGEDDETIKGYLKVVQAFADMGHSGGSASVAIPVIYDLLQYKALTPLTNDETEWMLIAEEQAGQKNLWQSVRQPDAFSNDGGKTHYLVSDRHRTVRKTQAK